MADWEDDSTTIFTSPQDMTSEERSAVKSGEKRGERGAIEEDPKRFGLARQRGLNKRKYDTNYRRIFGHD